MIIPIKQILLESNTLEKSKDDKSNKDSSKPKQPPKGYARYFINKLKKKLEEEPKAISEDTFPPQEWKDQNSKKVVSPLSNIHIHGESHFNPEEVNRIRQTIIQSKPDIIIHELDDDMDLYKKNLPGTRLYQLERGLDQNIYKYFPNDYASQFKHREDNMIRNIENIRLFHPEANIHVVVGDTHLRTIPTKELGDSSPFYNYDYKIYRSKTPEIN